MKASFLLAAGLFVASVSCERHEWNEVKPLHEEGSHEGGEHGGHEAAGAEHGSSHEGHEAAPEKEKEGH